MTLIESSAPISNQNIRAPKAIARFSLALAILSGGATLAPAQDLNMKPGLWEMTGTYESKNDPMSMMSAADKAQMEEAKAHMSPQQRAQMEAALTKAMVAIPRNMTATGKKCVTKESIHLTPGEFAAGQDKSNCKSTTVRSTATGFEIREVCSSADGMRSNSTIRIELPNPETLKMTFETAMSRGGGVYEVRGKSDGRWLGYACGDVKP